MKVLRLHVLALASLTHLTIFRGQEFITCYYPQNRHKRQEPWSDANPDGRFRKFTYDQILERDKTSLDIFWIKDKSLTDLDRLPDPDVLAFEIIDNLEATMVSFREIMEELDR